MISPEIPNNEAFRLNELKLYNILDSAKDKLYDNLTRIASEICQTKISLISIVDENRQWFKSKFGLDADETPRDYSFCAHAINKPKEVFIINDSRIDERFHDNPLVTSEPHVIFYAGVPLVNNAGASFGTLCVIDDKPKTLTESQIESLRALADQVMILIEYSKKENELQKLSTELYSKNIELENFFSLNLDLFCIADFNGNFVKLNSTWEQVLGYKLEEMIGKSFMDFIYREDIESTEKVIQRLANKEIVLNFDDRFICKNGELKTLEWRACSDGTLMYAVARDVTEFIDANDKLKSSEEKFRKLAENLPGVVYLCMYDENYTTIHINEKCIELTGFTPDEFYNAELHFADLYHPDDHDEVNRLVEVAIQNREPFHLTYRIYHKNGSIVWIEEWGEGIFENGTLLFLEGYMADITTRRNAELEQFKTKELLEQTSRLSMIGAFEVTLPDRTEIWSPVLNEIFETEKDYIPNSVSGLDLCKNKDDKHQLRRFIINAIKTGGTYEMDFPIFTFKGNEKWVRALGKTEVKNGECVRIYGTYQDISKEKSYQKEIIDSQAKLQRYFDNTSDFIIIGNQYGKLELLNTPFLKAFGYEEEELLDTLIFNLIHPADLGDSVEKLQNIINFNRIIDTDVRFKKKNGDYIWLGCRAFLLDDEEKLFCATARDITEEKKIRELKSLTHKLTEGYLTSGSKKQFFDAILEELLEVMNSEFGFMGEVFYEEETPYLKTFSISNIAWNAETKKHYDEFIDKGMVFRNLNTLFGYSLKTKQLVISNNPSEDFRKGGLPHGHPELKCFLGIPIILPNGTMVGQIGLANKPHGYNENDCIFLEPFLNTLATIIQTHKEEAQRIIAEKSLDKALKEKNAILDAIDESAIVTITDINGKLISVNDAFCEVSGYTKEEILGRDYINLNSGVHPKEFWKDMWLTINSGESWRAEVCNKTKDGNLYWVDTVINPIYDQDDKIIQFMSIMYLITLRKEAETELIKTKELLEQTSKLAKIGAFEVFFDTNTVNWSPVTKEIHEVSADFCPDLMGCLNFFKEGEHKNKMSQTMQGAVAHGNSFDMEAIIVTGKGNEKWVRVIGSTEFKNGVCTRLYGTFQDIHKKKIYQELRNKEQEKLKNVITGTNSGIWEWNVQTGITVFNERWAEIVGYTLEELNPTTIDTWTNLCHPEDLELSNKKLNDHFEGLSDHYEIEVRMKHKEGYWVWVLDSGKVMSWTDDGKPHLMFGTHLDISKSKLANEWQRQFVNEAPSAMALIDRDFKFIAASKKWVSDYKLEDTEFWGKTYFEVFSFKDAARLNGWRAIFEDCLNGHSRENSEEKFIEKDGSVIWIKWKVNPWYSDTGQVGGLIILTEDITKFKESKEEELRQVLKLTQSQNDRLRNFAHIVSHNLRSHSGNIQSLIALILEEKPELREDELIMMMDQSSGNLMETITHLSEVAFMNIKEDEKMSVVDVFDTLEKAIDNVSVLALNANVKISNNLKGNEKILGIPAYLDSILLNFITNGIKYRSTERNSFITIHSEINNENLIISIEDNGLGIDMKRHGTKLFGMYKTFHKNTDSRGIGLFITKNQIEAMGGKIEVESQVGVGTTFKIYFKQITN